MNLNNIPIEKLRELKKQIDEFRGDFKCPGKCAYCDGKGHITITHASLYEMIMMMHYVIVDFDFRKLIIQIEATLKAKELGGEIHGFSGDIK